MRPALLLVLASVLGGCSVTTPEPEPLPVLRPPTVTLTARLNGRPVTFEGFAFLRETADGGLSADLSLEECGLAAPFTFRGAVKHLHLQLDAPPAVRTYAVARRGSSPSADSAHAFVVEAAGDAVSESYHAAPDLRLAFVTYDAANGFFSGAWEGRMTPEMGRGDTLRFEGGRFSGRFERLAVGQTPPSTATRCYQGRGG